MADVNVYCLLCVSGIERPKVLKCGHGFCEPCLQIYYDHYHIQYQQESITMPCPTCRKLAKVPDAGLVSLDDGPVSLQHEKCRRISQATVGNQRCDVCVVDKEATVGSARYYCGKCAMNLCDGCYANHCQQRLFKSHHVVPIANNGTSLFCDWHSQMLSRFFCLDCDVPACTVCILQQHTSHRATEIHNALALHRETLRTLLNALGPKLDKMENKLKKISNSSSHSISRHVADIPLKQLQSQSSVSREVSLKELMADCQSTTSTISLVSLGPNTERIRKLHDLTTAILDESQSRQLITIYGDIVARIQNVLEWEITEIQDGIDSIQTMWSLSDGMQTSPLSSGFPSTYSMTDQENLSGGLTACKHHSLHEPEQSLLIKPKLLWKLEKQRSDAGELYNPCDVDFLPDGSLIVAEYDMINDKNNRLRIFDQNGRTREVLAQGKIRPLGLAITLDGNIVITDCKDKRLKLYTPSGQFITDIGKGQFGWPYGVAVNGKGQIIVTDAFNDSVSIYQMDGKKVRQFGSSGSGAVQFKNPYHVAIDAKDNILVSDSGNNCIKVFDPSGRFIFQTSAVRKKPSFDYGEIRKSRRKKLKGPRGLCVDHKGNILVADDYSRVCMFDDSGNFLRNLLTEDDTVKYPEALGCSRFGQIAVTEWNPNNMLSVKLFNMYE